MFFGIWQVLFTYESGGLAVNEIPKCRFVASVEFVLDFSITVRLRARSGH